MVTASRVMDAERASVFLLDPATGNLWSKVAEGMGHRSIVIPAGHGVAGWALQHSRTVIIPDAIRGPAFRPVRGRNNGIPHAATSSAGRLTNLSGETVGVIQVINKKTGDFGEQDISLFKAFAYQTAVPSTISGCTGGCWPATAGWPCCWTWPPPFPRPWT